MAADNHGQSQPDNSTFSIALKDIIAASFAGRIAAVINVGVVALLAVDAFIVGFWYQLAGVVTVLISGFVAGFVTAMWSKIRVGPTGSRTGEDVLVLNLHLPESEAASNNLLEVEDERLEEESI